MALSNWDTLTVNHRGESIEGRFTFPGGVWVESYKNWLYIHDPSGWTEELQGFVRDTVMEFTEGEARYKGIHLKAARGPQNGIYFAVWRGYGEEVQGMVGIGCYGFRDSVEYMLEKHPELRERLDPAYLDPSQYLVSEYSLYGNGEAQEWGFHFMRWEGEEPWEFELSLTDFEKPNLEELWVGVTSESVKYLHEWLQNGIPKELVAKVDLSQALRYNQGDAFLANAGVGPMSATKVGEAEEPLLTQALRAEKNE